MNISLPAALTGAFLALLACSCAAERNSLGEETAPKPRVAVKDADALFQVQRWSEAALAYAEVVAANPDDARAWHHLGYSLHALGRLDEAIAAHERAATFPATKRQSLFNLACAYSLLDRLDPAFEALDRALAAGFRDVRLLQDDPDLANLRADPRFASRIGLLGGRVRDAGFDFWLGEWDVFDSRGARVGGNSITLGERGFVVLENWTDGSGSTGRSMNFVDPADGAWKQVWVDDRGSVTRYSGTFQDGAMRFVGTRVFGTRPPSATRCTFTPNADGTVRQLIEDQDEKGAWAVTFDGMYKRRSAAKPPADASGAAPNRPRTD
jgi:hypothetical protein